MKTFINAKRGTTSDASKTPAQSNPHVSPLHSNLIHLQRTIGNQALGRLLRQARHGAPEASVGSLAPPIVHEVLSDPGQPLDASTRSFMESRFAHDFSRVRVHADAKSATSAQAVSSLAYTVGSDVVFGQNQYAPGTPSGRRLLAHELTHVVQQSPAPPPKGTSLQLNEPHDAGEQHAEATASRVCSGLAPTGPASVPARGYSTIQRDMGYLSSPPQKQSDPNAIIPVADFIRYVEAVEMAYPKESKTEIISRIRNQYYSGLAFDQLIPQAHTSDPMIFPGDGRPEVVQIPRNINPRVGTAAYQHLTAHADENAKLTGIHGDNPSPYVKLANGEQIDVGHVVLGLDALDFPTTGDRDPKKLENLPYSDYGIPNIDPAGWVADLGLASVWTTQHQEEGKPRSGAPAMLPQADLNGYYDMSAPEEDLLGDIDAVGIFRQPTVTAGPTLSQSLRAYYLGEGGQPAAIGGRWRAFCTQFGFTYAQSGTSISWDPSVKTTWVARINRFNDLADAEMGGAARQILSPGKPKSRAWPNTPAILDRFLNFVKARLEAELATTRP
jgi:hypothetical protein